MKNKGQGLVEYALILVFVAVVAIVVLAILGPLVANVFRALGSNQQPQVINPSDYWKEVVPPPAYDGKCYILTIDRVDELGISVWCVPNEDL